MPPKSCIAQALYLLLTTTVAIAVAVAVPPEVEFALIVNVYVPGLAYWALEACPPHPSVARDATTSTRSIDTTRSLRRKASDAKTNPPIRKDAICKFAVAPFTVVTVSVALCDPLVNVRIDGEMEQPMLLVGSSGAHVSATPPEYPEGELIVRGKVAETPWVTVVEALVLLAIDR